MTDSQKSLIYTWIMQGAQNNACNDCDSSQFTYSGGVKPILTGKCIGCHNPASPGGGHDLSQLSVVRSLAMNGKLMGAITHSPGYSPMPKGGAKLSDCRITQVRKWIEAGAPNN